MRRNVKADSKAWAFVDKIQNLLDDPELAGMYLMPLKIEFKIWTTHTYHQKYCISIARNLDQYDVYLTRLPGQSVPRPRG